MKYAFNKEPVARLNVSVVLPVFNRKTRLTKVVDSLLNQDTKKKYEIILVDDGSTDGSCDDYIEHPIVRVFKQPNAGAAVARHIGALNSRGKVVIFHDSDDISEPTKIRVLTKALEDNPDCVASFAITKEERPDWQLPGWAKNLDRGKTYVFEEPFLHFLQAVYPLASAMNIALVREHAVYATSNSNQYKAANDFHLQTKASLKGPFVAVNEVTAHYYQNSAHGITKQFGSQKQLMFSLFATVEVFELSKRKNNHLDLLRTKITIHGPAVLIHLASKRCFGRYFIKTLFIVLKYGYKLKVPRAFYWALSSE